MRRYADANGAYVGELYAWQDMAGVGSYVMVGASLDTLPLDWRQGPEWVPFGLDTRNDFLAPMPPNTLRVGGLVPADNEGVRRMVRGMRGIELVVQNRFIEYVLGGRA